MPFSLHFVALRAPFGRSGALLVMGMAAVGGLSACANRIEAPILQPLAGPLAAVTAQRLDTVLPADVLLLGEQHDAAEHQQIEQDVITTLASRGVLAAVMLEMADVGVSTAKLHPSSNDERVRLALSWSDQSWPWAAYGPAVMAAVRAGVPVVGANLPRTAMKASMADSKLDVQLPGPALKAQQQLIRIGHCDLLPEGQITPMTRIQIAKDISMANTVAQAAVPGKVVVLLSGSGHANRQLGVPQHLPAALNVKAVRLLAGDGAQQDPAFDAVWTTPAVPAVDYCEGMEKALKGGQGAQ